MAVKKSSLWMLGCLLTAGLVFWGPPPAAAGGVARIADSGEYLELSHHVEGSTAVDRLPLYRSGSLRYFSAGVGLEERMAEYPPFALKLVFTAGGKPFLAGVSVMIQPAGGGPAVSIAPEQVEGPWLFVDLPSGTYNVTATHGGRTQGLSNITVVSGRQKTVYLRWPEEGGLPVTVRE